jgi:hypothetical protein
MEDRQQKRGGLATAGHGACQKIAPVERGRNGVGLDGSGALETEVFEASEQVGVQLQVTEWQMNSLTL